MYNIQNLQYIIPGYNEEEQVCIATSYIQKHYKVLNLFLYMFYFSGLDILIVLRGPKSKLYPL